MIAELLNDHELSVYKAHNQYTLTKYLYDTENEDNKEILGPILQEYYWDYVKKNRFVLQLAITFGGYRFFCQF